MGEIQLFTAEQKIIFDQVKNDDFLKTNFYFTGGTALSYFYLQHRYSEDLDFFSLSRFNNQILLSIVKTWSDKLGFTYQSRFEEVVYIFNLNFNEKINVKVDFGYYPYQRIEKGKEYEGFMIDSMIDIAVNKLVSINQRNNIKDYVDLYFLLKNFSIYDLMEGLKIKFKMKTDPWLVASDFLKIEDFDVLPRMIIRLEMDDLKKFFRQKAKELGMKAVEK